MGLLRGYISVISNYELDGLSRWYAQMEANRLLHGISPHEVCLWLRSRPAFWVTESSTVARDLSGIRQWSATHHGHA